MLKSVAKFALNISILLYILFLVILPIQIFQLGYKTNIFPAVELGIIFYFTTYQNLRYWQVFIIGLILDQLYYLPNGTSSLILLTSHFGLFMVGHWFSLRAYLSNFFIFCGYALYIIVAKYLIITVLSNEYIEGVGVYFYYLTTILSYPTIRWFIEKPVRFVEEYAR